MISTITNPTIAYKRLFTTPNKKNTKIKIATTTIPPAIMLIERSLWVLSLLLFFSFDPNISLYPRIKEVLIIPDDLIIPIKPAIAIPPIPICRT